MKINVESVTKVQGELDRVQGKSRAGIYCAEAVQSDATEAEERLAKMLLTETERRGAVWTGYARAAGGKTWREWATVVTLERGTGGRWFVTHVSRQLVHERVRSEVRAVNADPATVALRLAGAEGVSLG